MAEAILAALKEHGIPELTTFADDPIYGWREDWDLEALNKFDWGVGKYISEQFGYEGIDLDGQWFDVSHCYWNKHKEFASDDPPVDYTVCKYLDQNRPLLRCRKPSP